MFVQIECLLKQGGNMDCTLFLHFLQILGQTRQNNQLVHFKGNPDLSTTTYNVYIQLNHLC